MNNSSESIRKLLIGKKISDYIIADMYHIIQLNNGANIQINLAEQKVTYNDGVNESNSNGNEFIVNELATVMSLLNSSKYADSPSLSKASAKVETLYNLLVQTNN